MRFVDTLFRCDLNIRKKKLALIKYRQAKRWFSWDDQICFQKYNSVQLAVQIMLIRFPSFGSS